jgi:hypothetical protein
MAEWKGGYVRGRWQCGREGGYRAVARGAIHFTTIRLAFEIQLATDPLTR